MAAPLRALVVGAGIVGAAIARVLARAGCDVVVVDRGATCGGTSASGEGNILVSDKGPGGGFGVVPGATMNERRLHFVEHLDHVRRLLVNEPRGHSAMSGAILQPPTLPGADRARLGRAALPARDGHPPRLV